MAEKRYPSMSNDNWWALRKKFRATVPKEVTKSYLASVLSMSEDSARANILPALEITGLIDSSGKPTDRAIKWRDDAQYPEVCKQMLEEIYPQELRDIASDASVDPTTVKNWFANHTGHGEAAVNKISRFYLLILSADPTKEIQVVIPTNSVPKSKTTTKSKPNTPPTNSQQTSSESASQTSSPRQEEPKAPSQPTLHLNIQIHISPDFSAEQIDKIFESMAKHLKDFSKS